MPKSMMLGISRSWKLVAVSVMMAGRQLSIYVVTRYRYSYFFGLANFSDDLGPRSKV